MDGWMDGLTIRWWGVRQAGSSERVQSHSTITQPQKVTKKATGPGSRSTATTERERLRGGYAAHGLFVARRLAFFFCSCFFSKQTRRKEIKSNRIRPFNCVPFFATHTHAQQASKQASSAQRVGGGCSSD